MNPKLIRIRTQVTKDIFVEDKDVWGVSHKKRITITVGQDVDVIKLQEKIATALSD